MVSEDSPLVIAANVASAAKLPDFMALWVPLIFGTFKNPAVHPIRQPPGNDSLGMDWKPPSFSALAP